MRIMNVSKADVLGHRLDEFFAISSGKTMPSTWDSLRNEGFQHGAYQLLGSSPVRVFCYSATAAFAPGLHLLILRESMSCPERVA
jgi:hypothetical protein